MITVTGENFSAVQTVQFGGHDCAVINSNTTVLTCQIGYLGEDEIGGEAPISVTLQSGELATVADVTATTFSFISVDTSVERIEVVCDQENGQQRIQVYGLSLSDEVELLIGGLPQS